MKKDVLNRKEYKSIKKMDRTQMNSFMEGVYRRGYEAGKKDTSGLTDEETREVLMKIKGIGDKKAKDIIEGLKKAVEEKGMA